ncbi:MAG: hypothetical protein C4308_09230 [Chitinophagaceae bacterium]
MDGFINGRALVEKNGKFGFCCEKGNVCVKLIYDDATSFSENRAAVKIDGKWGFVDKFGNEVIKPQYWEVYSFHEGLAMVMKGVNVAMLIRPANWLFPCNTAMHPALQKALPRFAT